MTPDRLDPPQDETLGESFWALARQLRRASLYSLAEWDVTPSQARVLQVLGRRTELRLSDLAEHLHIAARSTTEVVDGLENKGLLERRPDPRDRRVTLVGLTPRGAAVCEAIRTARGTGADLAVDRLSATDRAHLSRILRRLREE